MNVPKPRLSLVGAGPGDPEMITLKAINIIRQADVILYDALVNESLLGYASPAAVLLFVGKRYGCHALSQEEINRLIVENARAHGHVVRLKGGDPFVFGRATEEILFARQHGIPVAVIPGISSAIAVPASLMIPLTSRGVAESFWVTTGTTRSGSISADIELAARSSATVVILMAMSKLEGIMDLFAQQGKSEMPVAIIENGTTPQERIVTGTVRDIALRVQEAGIGNPAVIVVGEVVHLHTLLTGDAFQEIRKMNNTHEER
ncbi:uroporphyrinogen-III C-methyltransferase [Chitinophaga sp. MM2321]|uniref:uroporphyrinogen-III C-methyltransferase n=1 Tax=Chitinophaga sp. MM2321 TaxID=3137178 RepID=UPI0032D5AEB4